MILAIIPARSGSKSVKDKNIKPLNGRPLMAWSIKAGLKCKTIDKLVVSTDSKKYAQLAEFYGAEVIDRPAKLSGDTTAMIPVLQHAVEQVEKKNKVDYVVLLDPTSPLRRIKDIEKCILVAKEKGVDSAVTVCEVEHNPYYVMAGVENDWLKYPLFKPKQEIHRRQDSPKVYRINAAVYVIKRDVLMKGKIFTDKTKAIIMTQEQSGHIDSMQDFRQVEFMLKEGYVKLDY
jgi:CMP-N,N'-diacetyllegionaminic acid synthase